MKATRFVFLMVVVTLTMSGCEQRKLASEFVPTPSPSGDAALTTTILPIRAVTQPGEWDMDPLPPPIMTPTPPFELHPIARERMMEGYRLVEYPLVGEDRFDRADTPYQAFHSSFPAQLLPGIFPTSKRSQLPVPADVIRRIQQIREEDANRILEPLNDYSYNLYHDDMVLTQGIQVKNISVNASRTNFVMIFSNTDDTYMLHRNGIEPFNRSAGVLPVHVLDPIFVIDQLITALLVADNGGYKTQGEEVIECQMEDPECFPGQKYVVQADGNTVYSEVFIGAFVNYSLHGLWNWNDHWVVETDKTILVDGKPAAAGLERLFRWDILRGKPVYIYRNEQETGIVFDGTPTRMPYEIIVFEGYCCGSGRYNPRVLDDRVVFFAQREGVWYYAEVFFFE
jgi:hypothetical protein